MHGLKWKLPEIGYSKELSMFRIFTVIIAGTGAVFAALHVFFGYMGFDSTPNESTGVVPRFLDVEEYCFYLVLLGLFAVTALVAAVFRSIPAVALIPNVATVTYLMLLFDADLLTAGKMTFLLFSLFVFAGLLFISLYTREQKALDLFRYIFCLIGLFVAIWAIVLYFRAPSAPYMLLDTLEPIKELEGLGAVWHYERLEALTATAEAGNAVHYLRIALCQIILSILLFFLPRQRLLLRAASLAILGYLIVLVSCESLSYYPMFFVVPMITCIVGCLVYCSCKDSPAPECASSVSVSQEDYAKGDTDVRKEEHA